MKNTPSAEALEAAREIIVEGICEGCSGGKAEHCDFDYPRRCLDDIALALDRFAEARVQAELDAIKFDIFSAIGPNDGGAIHMTNVRRIINARGVIGLKPVSAEAEAAKRPPPPESLVGALNDFVPNLKPVVGRAARSKRGVTK